MNNAEQYWRMLRVSLLAALLAALSACTTTTIKPATVQKPAEHYQNIAVGEVTAKDVLWNSYAIELRRGLIAELIKSKKFVQVLDPAPQPLPPSTVLVTGQVTEVDKGDAALRWIIGFGAGHAHLTSDMQLVDGANNTVAHFSARKAYSGGAGIGGAGFVDMDDLAKQAGEEAAAAIAKWSETGELE
ncbi:MAG TPA: DUF4410 domain-containing protein [Candidatus Cybelea sp.]|nr:DUF4410 domain-containing protein [Candidatus Cybelea sp.]